MKNKASSINHVGSRHGTLTLVAMQLKETLSFSFKGDRKGALTKLVLSLLGIAAITAAISLVFNVLSMLGVLGQGGYLPIPLWNVLFFTILIINLLSCINKVTDALYFSADNQILLTLPVQGNRVFLSKIIVFCVSELARNCFSLWPLLLAYGMSYGMAWYFYPWTIVVMVLLSILPVALASVISIPFIYIKAFLRRFPFVQSVTFLAALIALTALIFVWADQVPEDLEILKHWNDVYFPAINDFANHFQTALYPLLFLSSLAVGYTGKGTSNPRFITLFNDQTGIILIALLAIIALLFLASFLLARPLYFRMASKSFEFEKAAVRHHYSKPSRFNVPTRSIVFDGEMEEGKRHTFLTRLLDRLALHHVDPNDEEEVLKTLNRIQGFGSFSLRENADGPRYVLLEENGYKAWTLVEPKKHGYSLYSPSYSRHKNHAKPSFFSFLLKEIRMDLRSYQSLGSNYLLFIVTPLAVLILNVIFSAMKKSFSGQMYTVTFNALVVSLILLATNVSVASVYSREGKANYQLRSSPVNYYRTIASKLAIRLTLVTGSLIFAIVVYAKHCDMSFVRMDLFFFSFYFVYLGHLIWSAELDLMNPQVNLYSEIGASIAINPNEAKSSVLAFVIAAAFTGLTTLFLNQSVSDGFFHLLVVSIVFLAMRALLLFAKIRAYGMSTYEGRNEK